MSSADAGQKRVRAQTAMEWTEEHDVYMCREILVVEPFKFRKGSIEKGKVWTEIAQSLNNSSEIQFKVNQRAVRERFSLIQIKYKAENNEDERSTGTSPEVTELDVLLKEIGEKEKVAEENMKMNEGNREKIEADRTKAEEAREKAMERVGQTKKRQKDDGEGSESKRKRRSGNDTLEYLRNKSEMERSLREKEIDIKKAELTDQAKRSQETQQQMQDMLKLMQQQQMQSQNMQVMLMQQQQQQSKAIVALLEKIATKQN